MARTRGRRPADPPEPRSAAGPELPAAVDWSGRGDTEPPPPGGSGRPAGGGDAPARPAPASAAGAPATPGASLSDPSPAEPETSPAAKATSASGAASRPDPAHSGPAAGTVPSVGRPSSGAGAPSFRSRPPTGTPPGGSDRSFRNGLIGGVIGGLVGGAAAWLALTHLVPPASEAELPALQAKVERLESSRRSAGSARRPGAEPRAGRRDAQQNEAGPALAALEERLGGLERSVRANPAGETTVKAVEDLRTHLATLEKQLAGLATDVAGASDAQAGDVAAVEALQSRLSALEGRLPQASATGAQAARLADVTARLDALEPAGSKLERLAGEVQQVREQGAAARGRLDGIASQVQGLDQRMQGLHGDLGNLESQVAEVASANDRREQAAALALITTQIDTAVARGQAFEGPVRSLTALGDRDEVVRQAAAELAPSAGTGVPSMAALQQSFAPVAGEIVQRERAPEGDSLIDQAASNLLRLVTVRPIGADVEGEGAAARAARAEAALDRGDLAAATAELEALDGPAAEAAADWLAAARSRLRATTALAQLEAHITELLTPTAN